MHETEPMTWTLVQPTARRREWHLIRGDESVAVLRIPTFRSGAHAEVGERQLRIRRLGGLRTRYALVDETRGEEIGGFHSEGRLRVLELEGITCRWQRLGRSFGFVGDDGEPLVTARVRSGLLRSSGEVTVTSGVDERTALVAALLACYLLIRRNDEAAAAAGSTAAVTAGA